MWPVERSVASSSSSGVGTTASTTIASTPPAHPPHRTVPTGRAALVGLVELVGGGSAEQPGPARLAPALAKLLARPASRSSLVAAAEMVGERRLRLDRASSGNGPQDAASPLLGEQPLGGGDQTGRGAVRPSAHDRTVRVLASGPRGGAVGATSGRSEAIGNGPWPASLMDKNGTPFPVND